MDKKEIHFKSTPYGYQVFEGEQLIGDIKTKHSRTFSVNLGKEERSLIGNFHSTNEAIRASIKFIKNE